MFLCNRLFFFKPRTAYAMRISDWSSDGCSSDLLRNELRAEQSEYRNRRQEKGEASEDERPRPCDRLIEQWQVAILALADEPHFLLGHMAEDQEGNQRRNKGDREDEGGNRSEARRVGNEGVSRSSYRW